MARNPSIDFKEAAVLNEHFLPKDLFYTLCQKLKTADNLNYIDDLKYVAFLRDFVFQGVSPEQPKHKKRFRDSGEVAADLRQAERLLKRLRNDLDMDGFIEFYRKCMEHLILAFPEIRKIFEAPKQPVHFGEILARSYGTESTPWKESYRFPLVTWGSIFSRNPPLDGFEQAVVDVMHYLTKTNAKPGRPEQRPLNLMSLALTQLMEERTRKPHYSLVAKVLNAHFNRKVSQGYMRQLRPSKDDKKALRQLKVIYQNRHRLHPARFSQ